MTLFSAYAEVFPPVIPMDISGNSFLCLRRGVSDGVSQGCRRWHFSLPTQRCFFESDIAFLLVDLFSAYAEVFPLLSPDVPP